MIEKCNSYKTSDGELHATVELAQRHELITFMVREKITTEDNAPALADCLIQEKAHIVDLLTMTATSKPKARRINGGTKKRTPKPKPEATATLPGV